MVPGRWGGAPPDPRLGPAVELAGGDLRGVIELRMIREALTSEGFPAEQAPPGFLEIEPRGAFGNEDLLHPWMDRQPFLDRRTLMARQAVCDHMERATEICRVEGIEQLAVAGGVA